MFTTRRAPLEEGVAIVFRIDETVIRDSFSRDSLYTTIPALFGLDASIVSPAIGYPFSMGMKKEILILELVLIDLSLGERWS